MQIKRRNLTWLALLGGLIGFVALSGAASPPVLITLIGLFVVSLLASVVEVQPRQIIESVQRSTLMRNVSAQAREAADRARRRSGSYELGVTMLDLGLITMQMGRDGMVMRRTRSVSKDDDGVRPFLTLFVPASEAERHANIRFEIRDEHGDVQYKYEMRTYLRDGENNILADNHLPLAGNEHLAGFGEWDLHVFVDDRLVALHGFSVSPSVEERMGRLQQRQERPRYEADTDEEVPLSLEDLLRSQRR